MTTARSLRAEIGSQVRSRRHLAVALAAGGGVALMGVASTVLGAKSRPGSPPQPSVVAIERRVQVSADEPKARHVESVLAVNPRKPENLISAAMVLDTGSVAVYASRDSGRTWIRATHGADRNPRFDGLDPAVAFDSEGAAYFLSFGAELTVWKSVDGGVTWSQPSLVPGRGWDRPWIACAKADAAAPHGRILVAGKMPVRVFGAIARDIIGFSASTYAGRKFGFPSLYLPDPKKELVNLPNDLVVGDDGQIYLSLQLFPPSAVRESLLSGYYATMVSNDGGQTFTAPRPGPEFQVYGHGNEGKSTYALGGARMALDGSGGSRSGKLYLAWLDAVEGFYRVYVSSSTDGGGSWSELVRVSDAQTDTDASTPSIAVDGSGAVGISWYDRRADSTNGCYQPYFAISRDGAATFSSNQLLDATQTCPLATGSRIGGPPPREHDPVSSDYRFKNGGDTHGLVGLPGGGFQIAWIQAGAEEMQLWSAALVVRDSSTSRSRRSR